MLLLLCQITHNHLKFRPTWSLTSHLGLFKGAHNDMNVLTFVPQSLTSFNEHHSREGFILICQHCKQKRQKKEVTLYFWRCHEILVYAHPSTIYIIFKGEEESKGTFFIKWMWMFDRSVSANKTNSILPARCSWVCFVFLFFFVFFVLLCYVTANSVDVSPSFSV